MKKIATLTAMAFLLATAGAFAQTATPETKTAPAKTATKTAKHHKGHKKGAKTSTSTTAPQK